MLTIKQLPSGSYNTLIYDYTDTNGKRHYKSITAPSKKEVKFLVAEFLASREDKKNDEINMTVGEAIDSYINSSENTLAASTIRTYTSIRRSAFQEIMDVPIKDVTNIMLQKAVDNYAKDHAPKTTKERYSLIVSCISVFDKKAKFDVTLPKLKKEKIEIPTKDEVMKLLECAKGTDAEIPLCLLALCGMRPCEISALEIKDIDFEAGTAYIHQDMVRDKFNRPILQDNTKTPAGTRTIKLFKPVLEILKPLQGKKGFVTDLKPDYIYRRNSKLTKQHKLKYYHPYSLRHYCVSVMIRMDVPKKYIADYVGHESEAMINAVYAHIMRDQKDDIFNKVERFYDQMQNEMQDKQK